MREETDVSIFLKEGFSPAFYRNLRRFALSLYKEHGVCEGFDVFYDNVRGKVEDILMMDAYTSTKGNFISFIHSMIRNEATKATSRMYMSVKRVKTKRFIYIDAPGGDKIANILTVREDTLAAEKREQFVKKVKLVYPDFDEEGFLLDLKEGKLTPMVFTYVWENRNEGFRGRRV